MLKKKFLLMFYLILLLFVIFSNVWCEDDPAMALPQQETTVVQEYNRYSPEGFALLSDEQKRTIYLDTPWLLPEDFNLEIYFPLFYQEVEANTVAEGEAGL